MVKEVTKEELENESKQYFEDLSSICGKYIFPEIIKSMTNGMDDKTIAAIGESIQLLSNGIKLINDTITVINNQQDEYNETFNIMMKRLRDIKADQDESKNEILDKLSLLSNERKKEIIVRKEDDEDE